MQKEALDWLPPNKRYTADRLPFSRKKTERLASTIRDSASANAWSAKSHSGCANGIQMSRRLLLFEDQCPDFKWHGKRCRGSTRRCAAADRYGPSLPLHLVSEAREFLVQVNRFTVARRSRLTRRDRVCGRIRRQRRMRMSCHLGRPLLRLLERHGWHHFYRSRRLPRTPLSSPCGRGGPARLQTRRDRLRMSKRVIRFSRGFCRRRLLSETPSLTCFATSGQRSLALPSLLNLPGNLLLLCFLLGRVLRRLVKKRS